MKKVFLIFAIVGFIIFIDFAIALEEETQKYNRFENITLRQICDCTFVNITSITYNGNLVFERYPIALTKDGFNFNKTIRGFSDLGTYKVTGIGNPTGTITPYTYEFIIEVDKKNPLKLDFKNNFTLLFIGAIFLFALVLMVMKVFFMSGTILAGEGLLLIINGFNPIISFGLIALGLGIMAIR